MMVLFMALKDMDISMQPISSNLLDARNEKKFVYFTFAVLKKNSSQIQKKIKIIYFWLKSFFF